MRLMHKMILMGLMILTAINISACKPSYEAPTAEPVMTTAPADAPYDIDFIQLNNDLIDSLSLKKDIFPFIKSVELDGDNDNKNIQVNVDIQPNVLGDAVEILMSEVTKKIADNAYIQDFRLKKSDNTQFGSVFDIYSYTYKVTSGDTVIFEDTIPAGGEIPFDPSMDGDAVKEALTQMQESETAANN
ncbi:hypothetical protein [Oribacterium sp. HCP3S3_B9]|uniref:hypothetical protein n=1 Tax=Oribacterium sp. HCP3S3_B9 TaxID=3438946 RepID=UPI003F88E480